MGNIGQELCRISTDVLVAKCDELLNSSLAVEDRGVVLLFKAHGQMAAKDFDLVVLTVREARQFPADWLHHGMLLEMEALALRALGRIREASGLVDELESFEIGEGEKQNSIRCNCHMLRGFIAADRKSESCFEHMERAFGFAVDHRMEYKASWAAVNLAEQGLRFGRFDVVERFLPYATHPKNRPTVALLKAELFFRTGQLEEAMRITGRAWDGEYGPLEPSHRSRAHYLGAVRAFEAGDELEAGRCLVMAFEEVRGAPHPDPELYAALIALRRQLAQGKEVAS